MSELSSKATEAGGEERILFLRSAELPGVEIRVVENSSRQWRCFSAGFEFLAPDSWHGDVVARRRREEIAPGKVFCAYPGEVYFTPRVHRAGTLNALVIDPEMFAELLAEHGASAPDVELRRAATMSDVLRTKLNAVFKSFRTEADTDERRLRLKEFVGVLLQELVEHEPARNKPPAIATPAERVREYLEHDPSAPTDLRMLSSRTGLSRFQVLRAFRRSYGLPPHAYKLCVRIGLAQKALRTGAAPAEVAAEYGFVDQSHFTRHFKRLVGVTPLEYAFARTRQRRARASSGRKPEPRSVAA
jgi:AraC-like DNA-binding protein